MKARPAAPDDVDFLAEVFLTSMRESMIFDAVQLFVIIPIVFKMAGIGP